MPTTAPPSGPSVRSTRRWASSGAWSGKLGGKMAEHQAAAPGRGHEPRAVHRAAHPAQGDADRLAPSSPRTSRSWTAPRCRSHRLGPRKALDPPPRRPGRAARRRRPRVLLRVSRHEHQGRQRDRVAPARAHDRDRPLPGVARGPPRAARPAPRGGDRRERALRAGRAHRDGIGARRGLPESPDEPPVLGARPPAEDPDGHVARSPRTGRPRWRPTSPSRCPSSDGETSPHRRGHAASESARAARRAAGSRPVHGAHRVRPSCRRCSSRRASPTST